MTDILVPIIFGWPFIIASLVCSVAGLKMNQPWWFVGAAVLFAPFSFYLSGWPGIRGMAFILPVFLAGAALAIYRQKTWMAAILSLPAFMISLWTAILVISQ